MRRKLLKALAATPIVTTLSAHAIAMHSVSPECQAQLDKHELGVSEALTASCLTSLGIDPEQRTLTNG